MKQRWPTTYETQKEVDKSNQLVVLRHGKSRSGNAEKLYHWSYWQLLRIYVIKTEVNPIKPWPIKYMKKSKENITGKTGLLLYMTLLMDLITTALDIMTAVLNFDIMGTIYGYQATPRTPLL